MKNLKYIAALLALALAGCVTGESISNLQPGMTKAQVEKVLGRPNGYTAEGNTEILQYSNKLMSGWSWDRADYHAILTNGRLTSWGAGTVRQNQAVSTSLIYGNVNVNHTAY